MSKIVMAANPPWVDRVLGEKWPSLEAKIPPDSLPTPRYGQKKKSFEELGCGHYGCVLETDDEDVVFKVTSDPTEAAFVVAATNIGEWPDGIVKYTFVYDTGAQHLRRPVFVLAREVAHTIGGWSNHTDANVKRAVRRLVLFKDWATMVRKYVLGAKDITKAVAEVEHWLTEWAEGAVNWDDALNRVSPLDWLRGAQKAAYAARAAQIVATEMSQEDVGYAVGETLNFYIEHGILLADVHLNNVGRVMRGDRGNLWVITDPGHMVALSTRWLHIEVPKL